MNRWKEIKAVLDAALEHSPRTRDEFVEQICGTDADLQAQVKSYLKFDSVEDDFLEADIFSQTGTDFEHASDLIGRKIGKYKIIEEIGAGGMGVVFLAERDDKEFEQKVAVKLLGQGLFSKSARERFFQERKILASLKHKNIAALIDGGTTSEGIPFLIMEYIEGKPLTEFIETEKPELDKRLEIFYKICDAVSFAHRNLIIHRDLKPANILITEDGEPKLLDFGIAKLVSENTSDLTQTRHRIFTPEYSSPEQIKGENITTATDIYTLGIVLYEMLTGIRPFDVKKSKNVSEIWNPASRENPTRPSLVLTKNSPAGKSINPKTLKGDLDTIIIKALKFLPEDRYASVEMFANDLQRFEKGLPVNARPETVFYRTEKFIKRNALVAGGLSIIFLAVLIGSLATLRQTILAREAGARAEQRLTNLRTLTNSLLFELNDEIGKSPTKARYELAEKSSKYLDELVKDAANDESVKFDLAVAYLKLADLQGRPYQPNIGQTRAARNSYQIALNFLLSLHQKNPSDEKIKSELAKAHEHFGYLLGIRFNDSKPAREHLLESIKLREELFKANPADQKYLAALADSYLYYGDIYEGYQGLEMDDSFDKSGRYRFAKKAFEIRKFLHKENPSDLKAKRDLAQVYQRLAHTVGYDGNSLDLENLRNQILYYHRQSLKLRQELAESPEAVVRDQRNFADQLMMMSDFLINIGENADAEKNLRRSKDIFHSLTLVDPLDTEAEYDLGNAVWRLGKALMNQKKIKAAKNELLEAKLIAEDITRKNPESSEYRGLLELIKSDLSSLR